MPTPLESRRICSRLACGAEIPESGGIKTDIGTFCSEECRIAIANRIGRFLINPMADEFYANMEKIDYPEHY